MNNRTPMDQAVTRLAILEACLPALLSAPAWARKTGMGAHPKAESPQESASPNTIPMSLIVSVEAKNGKDILAVSREDVIVFHEHDRLRVTDWVPLQGDQAGLQLLVLIDEGTTMSIGPPTTLISVGTCATEQSRSFRTSRWTTPKLQRRCGCRWVLSVRRPVLTSPRQT